MTPRISAASKRGSNPECSLGIHDVAQPQHLIQGEAGQEAKVGRHMLLLRQPSSFRRLYETSGVEVVSVTHAGGVCHEEVAIEQQRSDAELAAKAGHERVHHVGFNALKVAVLLKKDFCETRAGDVQRSIREASCIFAMPGLPNRKAQLERHAALKDLSWCDRREAVAQQHV
jgi:hypothetical protein